VPEARPDIASAQGRHFDIIVVGGGVTGLGVAVDAATRGLSCLLVEKDDLGSGTSSKSSKLIHGGLRYLQQGEVGLVYEALHERQRLLRNAPHLVQILPFAIPILTRDGVVSRKVARALGSALWMYDLTGGWRVGKLHRRLRAEAAHRHMPTMPRERLAAAYLYYDAAADDSRLCIALARTAADHGAVIVNHCAVKEITHSPDGRANGIRATTSDGQSLEASASVVVNAAGVWADSVRQADEGVDPQSIRPAKGIHITIPWELVQNDIAFVIPVKRDKRSLFVVPWIEHEDGGYLYTYVGTTDTDYAGGVDDSQCSEEDIDYVLEALNAAITTRVTREHVTGVWSGLRPLVRAEGSGKTKDLSRRHKVSTSNSGVISIIGGKLTTYRKMAEDTVDEALKTLGRSARCKTKRLRLRGAADASTAPTKHLRTRYGSDWTEVQGIIDADPTMSRPLVAGLPYCRAEAIHAVRFEYARTVDDVLSRRTRALLLDRGAALAAAPEVARLLATELGWNDARVEIEVQRFSEICSREERAARMSEAEYLASR
jgi:glycerol-3-phosphate dehydrogenase